MELYVKQLQLGSMENFVYLVGAADSPETAVIDAAWDVPAVLKAAAADGRKVTHALISHHHFDHVNGLPDVLAQGVFPQRRQVGLSGTIAGGYDIVYSNLPSVMSAIQQGIELRYISMGSAMGPPVHASGQT